MGRLAVLHPDLGMHGGAESVCMHSLEALQGDHELTLFTMTRPDFDELNGFYGTSVSGVEVRSVGPTLRAVRGALGNRLGLLQVAAFARRVRRRLAGFDGVVSTKNEFAVGLPSVQYVHSPRFAIVDPGLHHPSVGRRAYTSLCRRLAGFTPDALADARLVTNSQWSARMIERAYGTDASVVYPPVSEIDGGADWDDRESGVLTVGRIGPSKRIHRAIDLVGRLRERGHALHLHVVGPTTDDDYCAEVESRASTLEYVSLEGAVPRERLVDMMRTHRYGFHGREYEHFGIVVAEMVSAGMLPLVHDSGGPPEIVDRCQQLLYESDQDATVKMDALVSDRTLARSVRERLRDADSRFGREQFRHDIVTQVERIIGT